MKKRTMLLCLCIGMVSFGKAQGGRGAMAPADQLKAIQTVVTTLTADQSNKILAIFTVTAAKRDSMMKAGADRTAMRPLRAEANAKVEALLTDDQKVLWTKYQADMRARMQGGGTAPPSQK